MQMNGFYAFKYFNIHLLITFQGILLLFMNTFTKAPL